MNDRTPDATAQAMIAQIRAEAAVLRAQTSALVTDVPVPVHLRPALGYSSKHGVGRCLPAIKRGYRSMTRRSPKPRPKKIAAASPVWLSDSDILGRTSPLA